MSNDSVRSSLTRREFVKTAGLAAGAVGLLGSVSALGQQPDAPAKTPGDAGDAVGKPVGRKRALRLAHLTDVHVQPELHGDEGLATCLRHVQSQPDKPELILWGGDLVMDSFEADEARTKLQWDLWSSTLKSECKLPVEPCLGNHDIWGWNRKKSSTTGQEQLYGKKWALEVHGLKRPYRSFDRAGWHFVVLDSTQPRGEGYEARLDKEQFEWLAGDLAAVDAKTPVLVLSHIPILSTTPYFGGQNEKTGDWVVPGSVMHLDARALKDLFYKHRNVQLCLSGHLHLVDRVDYLGVTYLCNGAVCGKWWKGDNQETAPGYALLDLYNDGTFTHEYVTYGWQAKLG